MAKEKDSIATYLSRVITSDQAPQQKTRVDVRIAGDTFTILAVESEDYIRRVAQYVDSKIGAVNASGKLPLLDAAILAACNITDEQFKATENAESMRLQLKAYLDDIARLRMEVNDLRRDLAKATKE
ncbi:MAG: cell division protein ZapA [Clostridiaceae bacterium]|nr:cell division protein ZapA [Clostridiaceae bacterium]